MKLWLFVFLITFGWLGAHEGHHDLQTAAVQLHETNGEIGYSATWLQWFGSLHLFFLHFPLALINMVVIAELLFAIYKNLLFENAARFMLITAALITFPTAIFGLVYSYSASYTGIMETYLWWHMWLGILTALFTIVVLAIRENLGVNLIYYSALIFLFLILNITGFFGGEMAFGPSHILLTFK